MNKPTVIIKHFLLPWRILLHLPLLLHSVALMFGLVLGHHLGNNSYTRQGTATPSHLYYNVSEITEHWVGLSVL